MEHYLSVCVYKPKCSSSRVESILWSIPRCVNREHTFEWWLLAFFTPSVSSSLHCIFMEVTRLKVNQCYYHMNNFFQNWIIEKCLFDPWNYKTITYDEVVTYYSFASSSEAITPSELKTLGHVRFSILFMLMNKVQVNFNSPHAHRSRELHFSHGTWKDKEEGRVSWELISLKKD